MSQLSQKDTALLNELVSKYKAFKKPTEKQRLLVVLGERHSKTPDDIKKLQVLLSAEKKAIELYQKDKAVSDMLKSEKAKERKALEHKKFTLGGGLWSAMNDNKMLTDNLSYKQVFQIMVKQGLVKTTDSDGKELFGEINLNLGASHANP